MIGCFIYNIRAARRQQKIHLVTFQNASTCSESNYFKLDQRVKQQLPDTATEIKKPCSPP